MMMNKQSFHVLVDILFIFNGIGITKKHYINFILQIDQAGKKESFRIRFIPMKVCIIIGRRLYDSHIGT